MDRYLVGVAATIQATFTDANGATVDPGPVTIGIDRADGAELVAPLTATVGSGAAARSYTISPSNMALLDRLEATWTSATLGTLTTTVEVVGGFLFTIAEARAIQPLDNTTDYPTSELVAMRTTVEQSIEAEYGAALVPRFESETQNGSGRAVLTLKWPVVRAIRSASIDGTAVTAADIDIGPLAVSYTPGWTAGYGNVAVSYEHGLDRPPERLRRMGRMLAKRWLVDGPVDDRATSLSSEDGTFALATPGRGGSIFGLPDLDAAINASPYRIGIA